MSAEHPGTRLYTPKECADRWGVKEATVRQWYARDHIHGIKIGRRLYFPGAEVARFEACKQTDGPTAA